jgi:hypothetical protein
MSGIREVHAEALAVPEGPQVASTPPNKQKK